MNNSRIIHENGVNVYIEVNNGVINFNSKRKIPEHLVTIPSIREEEVIGREDDINKVKELVSSDGRVVLVNGLGGIGKTTLAKLFVEQFKEYYTHVAWIEVSSTVKEAFVFKTDLIDSLSLNPDISNIKQDDFFVDRCFDLIINRMRQLRPTDTKPHNLLIIDNASEDIEHSKTLNYISLKPHWKVLVTSREKLEGFVEYELGFLSPENASKLFYTHYKRENDDLLVTEILELLDFHTLLIEVVSKTSQSLRLSLSDILDRLKKKGLHISEETIFKIKHNNNIKLKNVFSYLLKIFDIANLSDFEKWVLLQFAVLPSFFISYYDDEGEGICNFLELVQNVEKDNFTRSLNNIVEKGWLLWDKKNDSFKLHQVLQEVVSHTMKPNSRNCNIILNHFLPIMKPQKNQNPLSKARWIDYVKSLIYKVEGDTEEIADLCAWLGNTWELTANYNELLKIDLKSVEIRERIYTEDDPKLANAYNNLALTFNHLGKFEDSLYYDNLAIKIREKNDDKRLAHSYNNISTTYEKMGNYDEAIFYCKKSIGLFLLDKELNFSNLAQAYNNIGVYYQRIFKQNIALKYHYKALRLRKENLDFNHPHVAESYHNLAVTYYEKKNKKLAKKYIKIALEMRKDSFGNTPNHPKVNISLDFFEKINKL